MFWIWVAFKMGKAKSRQEAGSGWGCGVSWVEEEWHGVGNGKMHEIPCPGDSQSDHPSQGWKMAS